MLNYCDLPCQVHATVLFSNLESKKPAIGKSSYYANFSCANAMHPNISLAPIPINLFLFWHYWEFFPLLYMSRKKKGIIITQASYSKSTVRYASPLSSIKPSCLYLCQGICLCLYCQRFWSLKVKTLWFLVKEKDDQIERINLNTKRFIRKLQNQSSPTCCGWGIACPHHPWLAYPSHGPIWFLCWYPICFHLQSFNIFAYATLMNNHFLHCFLFVFSVS